jgi:hypothetical protein
MATALSKAEWERREAEKEQKLARKKQDAIDKFGEELGLAFFNYTQGDIPNDQLAETLAIFMGSGSHRDKVAALTALLDIIDVRIEPISHTADEAARRTATF